MTYQSHGWGNTQQTYPNGNQPYVPNVPCSTFMKPYLPEVCAIFLEVYHERVVKNEFMTKWLAGLITNSFQNLLFEEWFGRVVLICDVYGYVGKPQDIRLICAYAIEAIAASQAINGGARVPPNEYEILVQCVQRFDQEYNTATNMLNNGGQPMNQYPNQGYPQQNNYWGQPQQSLFQRQNSQALSNALGSAFAGQWNGGQPQYPQNPYQPGYNAGYMNQGGYPNGRMPGTPGGNQYPNGYPPAFQQNQGYPQQGFGNHPAIAAMNPSIFGNNGLVNNQPLTRSIINPPPTYRQMPGNDSMPMSGGYWNQMNNNSQPRKTRSEFGYNPPKPFEPIIDEEQEQQDTIGSTGINTSVYDRPTFQVGSSQNNQWGVGQQYNPTGYHGQVMQQDNLPTAQVGGRSCKPAWQIGLDRAFSHQEANTPPAPPVQPQVVTEAPVTTVPQAPVEQPPAQVVTITGKRVEPELGFKMPAPIPHEDEYASVWDDDDWDTLSEEAEAVLAHHRTLTPVLDSKSIRTGVPNPDLPKTPATWGKPIPVDPNKGNYVPPESPVANLPPEQWPTRVDPIALNKELDEMKRQEAMAKANNNIGFTAQSMTDGVIGTTGFGTHAESNNNQATTTRTPKGEEMYYDEGNGNKLIILGMSAKTKGYKNPYRAPAIVPMDQTAYWIIGRPNEITGILVLDNNRNVVGGENMNLSDHDTTRFFKSWGDRNKSPDRQVTDIALAKMQQTVMIDALEAELKEKYKDKQQPIEFNSLIKTDMVIEDNDQVDYITVARTLVAESIDDEELREEVIDSNQVPQVQFSVLKENNWGIMDDGVEICQRLTKCDDWYDVRDCLLELDFTVQDSVMYGIDKMCTNWVNNVLKRKFMLDITIDSFLGDIEELIDVLAIDYNIKGQFTSLAYDMVSTLLHPRIREDENGDKSAYFGIMENIATLDVRSDELAIVTSKQFDEDDNELPIRAGFVSVASWPSLYNLLDNFMKASNKTASVHALVTRDNRRIMVERSSSRQGFYLTAE